MGANVKTQAEGEDEVKLVVRRQGRFIQGKQVMKVDGRWAVCRVTGSRPPAPEWTALYDQHSPASVSLYADTRQQCFPKV